MSATEKNPMRLPLGDVFINFTVYNSRQHRSLKSSAINLVNDRRQCHLCLNVRNPSIVT
jgi:hypothetical protein